MDCACRWGTDVSPGQRYNRGVRNGLIQDKSWSLTPQLISARVLAIYDGTTTVVTARRAGTVHQLGFTAVGALHRGRGAEPVVIDRAALTRASFRMFSSRVSHGYLYKAWLGYSGVSSESDRSFSRAFHLGSISDSVASPKVVGISSSSAPGASFRTGTASMSVSLTMSVKSSSS